MELAKWIIAGCAAVVLGSVSAVTAQTLQSGEAGFGRQWVRENPFTIQAVSLYPATWDINEYFGAGMTMLNRDDGNPYTIDRPPQYANARWQAGIGISSVDAVIAKYENLRNIPGNAGWLVGDEPNRLAMVNNAAVAAHIRQTDPSQPVYTTAGHIQWGASAWYGDSSHPDYSYDDYLNDFVNIIHPDILAYDFYPFRADGSTADMYLANVMAVRNKALASGIPYWGWLQAFDLNTRLPSESDNRFNVYTHLTAGYTGLLYWTYDYYAGTGNGLIDQNGDPTPLYAVAAKTNAEAVILGRTLRYLTSTDVRFVPGRHTISGGATVPNSPPAGLTNWTQLESADPHLKDVRVNWTLDGGIGEDKNGLIGFFTDDNGQNYFMLMNLNHGKNLSAEDTALSFTLTFDNAIQSILRMNRETGVQEVIDINPQTHQLIWTLPGGTGDLFKYNTGDFVVPEPGMGVLGLVGWVLAKMARPRRTQRKQA